MSMGAEHDLALHRSVHLGDSECNIGDGECLDGGSERFEAEVEAQKNRLLNRGLSARAALYRRSLEQRLIGSQKRPPGLIPSGPANRLA